MPINARIQYCNGFMYFAKPETTKSKASKMFIYRNIFFSTFIKRLKL